MEIGKCSKWDLCFICILLFQIQTFVVFDIVIFYIIMIKNNDVRHLSVDFYFTFSVNSFPAPSNRLNDLTKYGNGIT